MRSKSVEAGEEEENSEGDYHSASSLRWQEHYPAARYGARSGIQDSMSDLRARQ